MRAADTGSQAARRRFGSPQLTLEDARGAWSWPRPEAWLRDLRYGIRMMRRRLGFALTVVATLALGIGATVTIFSVVDTVVIRSLPYRDADRLVAVQEIRLPAGTPSGASPGRLEDWNRLTRSFEAIAGSYTDTLTETTGSAPEQLAGAFVSPKFFSILGTRALVGRVFTPEEERFGGPMVVVISHGLWQRRFASDPDVLGRKLLLSGLSYAIVGVMPSSFQFPTAATELWGPKQANPQLLQIRQARFYRFCVARLKGAVTMEQAQAELETVQAELGRQYPKTDAGWTVRLEPLKERQVGRVRLALWLLFGSSAILLLIACTNVACLLLAQFNARAEEVAIRRALGASRAAIARQLLAEGLAYALAGSSAGVLLAFAAVAAVRGRMPELPRISELSVDLRVLAFAAVIGVAVATAVSIAPMLQTLRRNEALPGSGRAVIAGNQLLPRSLVSAQLALATVLLVGSSLFVKSLLRLQETDLGLQSDQVLTFRIGASFGEGPPAVVERHARTLDALAALPGVQGIAMAFITPGTVASTPVEFRIRGQEDATRAADRLVLVRYVTSGYFSTLGIPILGGQTCRMDPDPQRPFEALVNQTFVNRFLSGRDPTGLTIAFATQSGADGMRIVGVVGDAREAGYTRAPEPVVYGCGYLRFWPDSPILVRTNAAPELVARSVREAVRALEPARAVYAVSPLPDVLWETLAQNRFRAWLIGTFSAIALILAAVGLYGVTTYMVSQRVREFGIRMALGAKPGQIWADILGSGARLAGIGVALGVLLAFAAARLIATLLYGVGAFDGIAYASAAGVLLAAALLACLFPGRRATSIDPVRALREQ